MKTTKRRPSSVRYLVSNPIADPTSPVEDGFLRAIAALSPEQPEPGSLPEATIARIRAHQDLSINKVVQIAERLERRGLVAIVWRMPAPESAEVSA